MVKKIGFEDLNTGTQIMILLGFFLAIATFIMISSPLVIHFDDTEDFARWECYNETSSYEIDRSICDSCRDNYSNRCEDYFWSWSNGTTCNIKINNEVCEIV